jgi:transposase-like protein
MKKYPESLQDFFDIFKAEEDCRDYLAQILFVEGFVCKYCKATEYWKFKKGIYRCRSCRKDISLTAGTMLEGRHLELKTWFLAMWLIVFRKSGISTVALADELGIKRQRTAWQLLSNIKEGMVRPGRDRISGTVEVDEIFVGGVHKGKRGRGAAGKVMVLVAVEDTGVGKGVKGIGRIRMNIIPDASAGTLCKTIETMVTPESTIRTDEWASYPSIIKHNYKHLAVERGPVGTPGEDPTPLVHRISSLLKRWLLGTHQGRINEEHLQKYLNEFVFRFNRRKSKSRGMLFYRLVQGMLGVFDKKG